MANSYTAFDRKGRALYEGETIRAIAKQIIESWHDGAIDHEPEIHELVFFHDDNDTEEALAPLWLERMMRDVRNECEFAQYRDEDTYRDEVYHA